MKAIVQAGIGEDAAKVARALEIYVKQGKTAACLQYPNMMKRMGSRIPENLDYNALRLARTELSAAYGAATIGAAQASPAIGKIQWVLSNSHPKPDICDTNAAGGDGHGVYDAKDCPQYPAHPNCLCTIQPAPDKPEDFARKMKEWLKDPSSHPDVEEWYQKTYKKFDGGKEKDFTQPDNEAIIEAKTKAKVEQLKQDISRVEQEMNRSTNRQYLEKEKEYLALHKQLEAARVEAGKKGIILTSELEKSYGKTDIDAIKAKVKTAPENIRVVWNRFEDKMKVLDTAYTKTDHYDSSVNARGIRINALKDRTATNQKPYKTIFHELGHLIDHFAGKNRFFSSQYFQGGVFADTLRQEAKDYATKVKEKLRIEGMKQGINPKHFRIADAYDAISRELLKIPVIERREISDIWHGATKKKVNGGYGHSDKGYWDDPSSLPSEAMAHMFCATIQNPESLSNIQKYFPKSYDIFLEMMAFIAEKGAL